MSRNFPDIQADSVPASMILRDANSSPVVIEAKAGDGKPSRFSMTAYNGGELILAGFGLPVVVDLAGMRVTEKSRPILMNHNTENIVGHSDSIKIGRDKITASGIVSGAGEAARSVIDSSALGFPWQASIGATPKRIVKVEAGETALVNGKNFRGPIYVAAKTELKEISFVAIGADDTTQARVAASAGGTFLETFSMNFEQWLKANGHDTDSISASQRVELQAKFDAEQNAEPGKNNTDDPVKNDPGIAATDGEHYDAAAAVSEIRAELAERDRLDAINLACGNDHPEVRAQAIKGGWDETRTQLEVLRAKRPSVHVATPENTNDRAKAIEAALCLTAGLDEKSVGEDYGEKTMNAAVASENRGMGLHSLMYEAIRAFGGHVAPGSVNDSTIRAAFQAGQSLQASGFSTLSLSGVLGNVANKALLAAYRGVNIVGDRVARVEPNVNSFKPTARYRLTGSGSFQKIGPDGEIKHMGLTEESYGNQLDTEAAIITLTRKMMIDDDLGAFLQIPRILGRASAVSKEKAIFAAILGNSGSFFAAGNNNYITGADTALSIGAVTAAEQALMDQVDDNGDPLLIAPKLIVVPTGLKVVAEQLFRDILVNETTTANKPKPTSNPHAGKFEVVASPYLNAAGMTNSSATGWYLLADPNDVPVVEIAYLRGRRVPSIESGATDFNTLGVQWRSVQDFGVALQDKRGGVFATGA